MRCKSCLFKSFVRTWDVLIIYLLDTTSYFPSCRYCTILIDVILQTNSQLRFIYHVRFLLSCRHYLYVGVYFCCRYTMPFKCVIYYYYIRRSTRIHEHRQHQEAEHIMQENIEKEKKARKSLLGDESPSETVKKVRVMTWSMQFLHG